MFASIARPASRHLRRSFSVTPFARPSVSDDVGIVAISHYIPKRFVSQADLEVFDKVSKGKYEIGLGQKEMSFCGDNEDINSIALTAVSRLLSQYNIDPRSIGRLEVGTETIIDKSKAVKTTLMKLFEDSGNHSLEGLDTMNACYGGTNAVLNACLWLHAPDWDGRYAIVVCGDIAVYEAGPARPSGGAGAVAMLLGRKAPLVVENGLKSFHMENAYDFYKPDLLSEYPAVDGKDSINCYLRALDNVYDGYAKRFRVRHGRDFRTSEFSNFIFHAPYNKLVRKGYMRSIYNDYLAGMLPRTPELDALAAKARETTYQDKDVEKGFLAVSDKTYDSVIGPTTVGPARIGNTYTGSVYVGLASLISEQPELAKGSRVGIYSYGSGLAAALFSLRVDASLKDLAKTINLKASLDGRTKASPEEFTEALKRREQLKGRSKVPQESIDTIPAKAYYLKAIDSEGRREYGYKD